MRCANYYPFLRMDATVLYDTRNKRYYYGRNLLRMNKHINGLNILKETIGVIEFEANFEIGSRLDLIPISETFKIVLKFVIVSKVFPDFDITIKQEFFRN